jgi:hypothetical protein
MIGETALHKTGKKKFAPPGTSANCVIARLLPQLSHLAETGLQSQSDGGAQYILHAVVLIPPSVSRLQRLIIKILFWKASIKSNPSSSSILWLSARAITTKSSATRSRRCRQHSLTRSRATLSLQSVRNRDMPLLRRARRA